MYIQAAADLEWKDPPTGYYLGDVKEKILWTDEETGALVTLMKFGPGPLDKRHRHPKANQWDFWIKGKLKEGDRPVEDASGQLGYVSKRDIHGGTQIVEECLVLFHWDGPRDPEVIDE